MEKDLSNAKALAVKLENEADELRKLSTTVKVKAPEASETALDPDVAMEAPNEDEEPEPREQGSDAVERRIEKVMSELRQQGLVDANDDKAYETRKVRIAQICLR
jgi:hypothetical protein